LSLIPGRWLADKGCGTV